MINSLYRKAVLTVALNPGVEKLMNTHARKLAGRFISGDTTTEAIAAIRRLHEQGIAHNLDLLGEYVDTPEPAYANTEAILDTIFQLSEAGIVPYNSLKLSALGQGQAGPGGHDLGEYNARRIVALSKRLGGFVNLDMEDHKRVDITLQTYRRLAEEYGSDCVGTVLQSYLYRTPADLAALADLSPRLRFVKGAYLEPESVAMQNKADIDAAYLELVFAHLKAGHFAKIATHDHELIYRVMMFALAHGIPKSQYEFQLLYGVREDLQRELAADGYGVRSYIPYGTEWYGYYSRRIAERPQNALFVLRGLLGGK